MGRSDADVVFHVASYGMSGREQVGQGGAGGSGREQEGQGGAGGSGREQVGQGGAGGSGRSRWVREGAGGNRLGSIHLHAILLQLNKPLIEAVNIDGTRNLIEGLCRYCMKGIPQ